MNVEEGIQLGDLVGMVRRRWTVVAFVAGAMLLVAIFVASVLRNEFSSYATILVEPQLISRALVTGGLEETDLNARLNLMTAEILSRRRLSKIIDDLGLYPEESEEMTREEVILLMRSHIFVEPVLPELQIGEIARDARIDTFRIHFGSHSARTAADVSNRIANDFIEEHIKERVQVASETAEFIENELNRIQSRMREVDEAVARVKEENAGTLPEDLSMTQLELARAFESMRSAERRMAEAESDVVFWENQALITETQVARDEANPTRQLKLLELQFTALKSRGYTEKHPDLINLKENIAELKKTIELEESGGGADGEDVEEIKSPTQQAALAQMQRSQQQANALRAELQARSSEVAGLEDRIAATPQVAERLASLERERDTLQVNFREYTNKRLSADVAANMERRQKGEQFRVLETAAIPTEPSSPNRPLIVVIGLLLGLALGGGVAVLLEAIDASFHDARRLQSNIRVPVLAAIPPILLEADVRAQRRRQMRAAFASVFVTGFVLSSSAIGYVYVNGAPGFLKAMVQTEEEAATPEAAPAAQE